jgi:TDG/mug DNA glycosylase family protein
VSTPSPRPTPAELEAARDVVIPDVIADGLRVLFCGINPGLWSGATGDHFARPGNRFWPVLHRSGFTPRQLAPWEKGELLALGLGVTNLVPRTTAAAAELTTAELRAGALALEAKVARHRPRALAIVGMGAYRTAFRRPKAAMGRQPEDLAGAEVWMLPNPSGLQARYQLPDLVAAFGELRAAVS